MTKPDKFVAFFLPAAVDFYTRWLCVVRASWSLDPRWPSGVVILLFTPRLPSAGTEVVFLVDQSLSLQHPQFKCPG